MHNKISVRVYNYIAAITVNKFYNIHIRLQIAAMLHYIAISSKLQKCDKLSCEHITQL